MPAEYSNCTRTIAGPQIRLSQRKRPTWGSQRDQSRPRPYFPPIELTIQAPTQRKLCVGQLLRGIRKPVSSRCLLLDQPLQYVLAFHTFACSPNGRKTLGSGRAAHKCRIAVKYIMLATYAALQPRIFQRLKVPNGEEQAL
jgi:hypothetical protein